MLSDSSIQPDCSMKRSPKTWSAFIATLVLAAGAFIFTGVWVPFEALDRRPRVTLTGVDNSGRLEVPVINLWQEPGFGRDNRVAARVQMPADGQVEARLVSRTEIDGLTWDEVQVRDARGWVVSRFVAE
jgi:hypothetical protein